MKILFVTNLPSPYRVDFFNELGKHVELTVCYERKSSKERDDKWTNDAKRNYEEYYANAYEIGTDRTIGLDIIRFIRRNSFDFLFLTGYSSPTIILTILYCQLRNIPYYMEDDGGLYNDEVEAHSAIKRILLSKVKGYLTTTSENIEMLERLGVDKRIITKYPFTSVTEADMADCLYRKEQKTKIRESLNVSETKMVIAVGQFIYRKGFDILLHSWKNISSEYGLYFVGGKPTDEYLRLVSEMGLSNVHFVGFCTKDELKNYYAAADLFVLPTREDIWGLVINEAMAAGLPVVTTNRCGAGLEMINNGKNGYIVPVGDENKLRNAINYIIEDDDRIIEMGKNAFETGKKYTIENMSKIHLDILELQ